MYWAKPELELLNEHYKSVEDKVAVFEIRAGLNLIEKDYKDMICLLPSLLPHSISFEHLWSLIPPGSLVVSQHDLDFTDTWCVLGCAIREAPGGNFLSITAECIVWDGGKMAYTSKTLKIYEFSGFVTIGSLPYIPLKYHPDRQAVIQKVRQRSNKAINFWTPGFQIQEHQGTGIAEVSGKVRRHAVSKDPRANGHEQRCLPVTYSKHSVQRTSDNRPGHDAKHPTLEQYHAIVVENAQHSWET